MMRGSGLHCIDAPALEPHIYNAALNSNYRSQRIVIVYSSHMDPEL
jgi:hypothetical protein